MGHGKAADICQAVMDDYRFMIMVQTHSTHDRKHELQCSNAEGNILLKNLPTTPSGGQMQERQNGKV